MIIARRLHLYPSRTQKLSSVALMILGGRLPGKVGHRRFELGNDYLVVSFFLPRKQSLIWYNNMIDFCKEESSGSMAILKIILVLLMCIPIGYFLLWMGDKLMDQVMSDRRKNRNDSRKKRTVHNSRRSRWGR